MASRLDENALRQLFVDARTHRAWQAREVPNALLQELVQLAQWGPTASNTLPARIVLVTSQAAKQRLKPHLNAGNVDKTMSAPATAIIGYDTRFFEHPPKGQEPLKKLPDEPEALIAAMRNGSLQGGYFILAARALGLDAGPMSGFDNAGVDAEFFAGTSVKSNFLCNLGYGDPAALRPRGPRFAFADIAQIL
jgi:3-hydroxypropanoate dehydrogenase